MLLLCNTYCVSFANPGTSTHLLFYWCWCRCKIKIKKLPSLIWSLKFLIKERRSKESS